jgi:hypothetical protein
MNTCDEVRPAPGDRVKLCGDHRWSGSRAVYLGDRETAWGLRPFVRTEDGTETLVMKPESQMKKL